MKASLTFLASLICVITFAQNNLFSTGDFGMRYGVGYSGSVTQQIRLSGIVARNVEFGAGFTLTYTGTRNSSSDTVSVNTNNGFVSGNEQYVSRLKSITANINPFVAYHFPLKGNLDLYAGVFTGFGISKTLTNSNMTITNATNYQEISSGGTGYPMGYNVVGGVLAGFQYFFYKRFAIGAEASIGGRYNFAMGNVIQYTSDENTGSANSNMSSSSQRVLQHENDTSFNLATTANVAICLTMYLAKHRNKDTLKMPESNP